MKTKDDETPSGSEENSCWVENPQAQLLRVEVHDGEFYLFPYAWLVWVQFKPIEKADNLVIVFSSHKVNIVGKSLRALGLAVQKMKIECIRATPPGKDASLRQQAASIEKIQIEATSPANG